MLKDAARRLAVVNASVFIFILLVFSSAVFLSVSHNIDREKCQRLQLLSDALVDTIEPSNDEEENELVPDLMTVRGADGLQSELTLQWFDPRQKLLAQKGLLPISVPFDRAAALQVQRLHHAMLTTRPVTRDGHLIGYLRVGLSMADTDNYKRSLMIGLGFGVILALAIGSIALSWLVRLALKPLELSIRKLSEFTGDASHELKSPIMAIKTNGAVALKYSEGLSETHKQNIEMMLDGANQMSRTIADLLMLAESENELPASVFSPVHVGDLFRELENDSGTLDSSCSIAVKYQLADPSLTLMARKEDLKLALGNVIKNAIAYCSAGGSVNVGAARVGNKVQFEIQDTGIGISEDELPHIFDRFWRSDKARSYRSGGSGLGLSIVKSIIQRYKGQIIVKSKLGEGTLFIIIIPQRC
jgi:two-component system, OmpR family, manganese sensing sensor histidine kinase